MKRLLPLLLLFAGVAKAQTIGLQGGASSLFNAEGGSVTLYTADTNSTLGIGVSNGRLVAGANTEFLYRGWDVTAGDKSIFLTTQQLGLSSVVRGFEAHRRSGDSTLAVFGGAVGQAYSTPYFSGVTAKQFGSGVMFTHKLAHWDLSTVEAWTSGKATALEGASFHWRGFQLQGTAGLLEGRKYLISQSTWRLSHASFDAGRQTFIWQAQRSTVTSVNVSAWYGPLTAHASAYRSSLARGENAGVGLRLGRFTMRGDSFWSKQRVLSGSVYEQFTRHWSLAQFITRSGGSTSVNFGASYTSNLVTASVGWQEAFIPFGSVPFQKVLSVTLAFQLPHGTSLNLATVAAPNGGVRWSSYGGTYVQAPWLPATKSGGSFSRKIRGFEIRGRVLDQFDSPVCGAAIVVNGVTVYSDLQGQFVARVKRNESVDLIVDVDSFTAPGTWEVVATPASAAPNAPIEIVVRRKRT